MMFAGFSLSLLTTAALVADRDVRLAEAVRRGDTALVASLVRQKVDVNAAEPDGSTALLWAAYRNDPATARGLITAGANVNAANRLGVTPLLLAARHGNPQLLEALLVAGADPHTLYEDGETSLMAAAASGSLESVNLMLTAGVDVNAKEQAEGQDALMWAADAGHLAVVQRLLAVGANPKLVAHASSLPNVRGDGGRMWTNHSNKGLTALMLAARQGHIDVARALVKAGAPLDHANPDGVTTLMIAVMNDRLDMAAMLISEGASVNDGSLYELVHLHNLRTNETVSEATRPRPTHENATTPVDLANAMLERGADPNRVATHTLNIDGTGVPEPLNETPFVRALRSQDVAMLRLLVAKGANVNTATAGGQLPMTLAMGLGRPPFSGGFGVAPGPYRFDGERTPIDAVKLLIEAGADVNATAPSGDSPMHAAAQSGDVEIITLLAGRGATLDVRNNAGFTPLDVAMGKQPPTSGRGGGGAGPPPGPRSQPRAVAALRKLMGLPEAENN